jgi:hypothetical protein
MVNPSAADPGPAASGPRIGHYLAGDSDPTLLAQLAEQLSAEAGVTVRVLRGTVEQPAVLAIAMSPERAERLRGEFQGRLLIETDQEVGPYGK